MPFFAYEIIPDELLGSKNVDERIAALGKVRTDLLDAVQAVESLQKEAQQSKDEIANLNEQLETLTADKKTAETLLKIPETTFARVLERASSRAQWKGIALGFVLGILASYIATWLWDFSHPRNPHAVKHFEKRIGPRK
ncbi:MAG TPA: hypothetical protein VLS45_07975 [Methylomicrobium sp.]|nr:hypothetical protein [Methylomicrobium sp.]